MDFAEQQRNPGKHVVGIGIVLALHLLIGWGLVNGLAQRLVEVMKSPLETKIIEEVKPPPPPPPENLPPPPKFAPPPPSFVPPPEVNVNAPQTAAPTITVTQVAPPVPVRVAPPPVVAPVHVPTRTEPKIDFAAKCEKPEYSAAARRAEAQGTVVVVYTMDTNGIINEATVEKSAGPTREHKMLDRLTLEAVKACRGTPGALDGKPEKLTSRVAYDWKITE